MPMPEAILSTENASTPAMLTTPDRDNNKPREMRDTSMDTNKSRKVLDSSNGRVKEPAICPTDDDTVGLRAKREKGSEMEMERTGEERKKYHKQSWDYIWRTGLAGGLAGSAAKTIVAPLDRVKILFQARSPSFAKYASTHFGTITAMRDIYHSDGISGLFRGHSATLLRIFPYAAIKFLAYEQIRSVLIKGPHQETPGRRLLSGSAAGVTSVFFTYPLEVIRVRLAFETKTEGRSGLVTICRKIYHEIPPPIAHTYLGHAQQGQKQLLGKAEEVLDKVVPRKGVANFYRGFSATMLGMLPYAGMSFLTHDTASDLLRLPLLAPYTTLPKPSSSPKNKPPPLRSWAELLAGGIAGLVSQTSAYPLEVIRRRMQVGGTVGDGRRLRILETAKIIARERGWRGFWVGLTIGYVKVAPMVAVSFWVYERAKMKLGI